MYKKGSPVEIRNPTHWNLVGRSVTDPATCAIAQQYSSTTLDSLRFHSCNENSAHV
jgi:hypothetical protein